MNPRKKITLAREIFERKEREEARNQNSILKRFKFPIIHLNLSPQKIEVIKKLIKDELIRKEKADKIDKIKKFMGSIFAILLMIVVILGCVWLIKIFIGGIFG